MTTSRKALRSNAKNQPTAGKSESNGDDLELERIAFQEFLDESFPIGAMCALFAGGDGVLDATASVATGRLLCTGVEWDEDGRRWQELVIDPRGSAGGSIEVLRLWVTSLRRHGGAADLWECAVRQDGGAAGMLRLNADPSQPWRPTREMRRAVTEVYAELWPARERSR